jgi:hypothetical protein
LAYPAGNNIWWLRWFVSAEIEQGSIVKRACLRLPNAHNVMNTSNIPASTVFFDTIDPNFTWSLTSENMYPGSRHGQSMHAVQEHMKSNQQAQYHV